MTVGSDHPFIGLDVISQVQVDLSQDTLTLPGPDKDSFIFATYLDPPSVSSSRSYLSIFYFQTQATVSQYYVSDALRKKRHLLGQDTKPISPGLVNKHIDYKLHDYSHLHYKDLITLCQRAVILTPLLSQSLRDAHLRCTFCPTTDRSRRARQVSLFKLLE